MGRIKTWVAGAALVLAIPAPAEEVFLNPLNNAKEINDLYQKYTKRTATPQEVQQLKYSVAIGYLTPPNTERAVTCTIVSLEEADEEQGIPHTFVTDGPCLNLTRSCESSYYYFQSKFGRLKAWQCHDPHQTPSGITRTTAVGPGGYDTIHDLYTVPADPLPQTAPIPHGFLIMVGWSPERELKAKACRFVSPDPQPSEGFLIECEAQEFQATPGSAIVDPAMGYTVIGLLNRREKSLSTTHQTYRAHWISLVG